MSIPFEVDGNQVMVFGLQAGRDDYVISRLRPMLEASPRSIDGISLELKGYESTSMEMIVEVHGRLTPTQLRLLAEATDLPLIGK